MLRSEKVVLRSVDFSDIDTLLLWENANDEPLYGVYEEEFSCEDIVRFVENQMRYSIEQTEQLRLMICSPDGERFGAIDLTEYDGRKAFVSILIFDLDNRRKGFGESALRLVVEYSESLGLRDLYAIIHPDNRPSINLFEKVGFIDEGAMLYHKRI